MTRILFPLIGMCFVSMLIGCGKKVQYQTAPWDLVRSAPHLKEHPFALVDFVVISTGPRLGEKEILVSAPNETAVRTEKGWAFHPSPQVLSPMEIMLVSLRYAGLAVEPYDTVTASREAGARYAVLGVLHDPDVLIHHPQQFEKSHIRTVKSYSGVIQQSSDTNKGRQSKVEASIRLYARVLDLTTSRTLWQGPLVASVDGVDLIPPLATSERQVEGEANTGGFETEVNSVRTIVAGGYVQLASVLMDHINRAVPSEASR